MGVGTIFCLPSICVLDPKKSKNIIFSSWVYESIQNDVVQPIQGPKHLKYLFQLKWPKCPLSALGLTKGQNPHKTTFFIVLHQTRASQRILTTLTKFDPKLILGGCKNPNFDPSVRTGWNQCHCEDYQILIPTTIHGLKSEFKRRRYHENQDDTPIDALRTSESHNFWFDHWFSRSIPFWK